MIQPENPPDESARLSELHSFQILDTPPDPEMDAILDLLLALTGAPIGTITFVDADRQWFKSRRNISARETSRQVAFCAHGILGDDLFVVRDAREDPRFNDNPLVTGDPNVVFYAGMPLTTTAGHNVGMICVQDNRPRNLDIIQKSVLRRLGGNVVALLELRRERERTRLLRRELEHRVQNTLQFLASLVHLHSGTGYCVDQAGEDWVPRFAARLDSMSLMMRAFNAHADTDEVSVKAHVCPIIQEMLETAGLHTHGDSCPAQMDDFSLDKNQAMVLASLAYELITTIIERTPGQLPGVRFVRAGDLAEFEISHALEEEMYSDLISDYRFAIIETLSRRLHADASYDYNCAVFSARYRFPAAS